MGKVTSLAVAGLELWFNSNDHPPPHFHAERAGEWEVRVFFLRPEASMVEIVWPNKKSLQPSASTLAALAAQVAVVRVQLLAEWHQKVLP